MGETLPMEVPKEAECITTEVDNKAEPKDTKECMKMETDRSSTPTIVITNNNQVDLISEEKPLVPGVMIRAATLKQLAVAAVESYGKTCCSIRFMLFYVVCLLGCCVNNAITQPK